MNLADTLWLLQSLLVSWVAAGTETTTGTSVKPAENITEGQGQAVSQGQYKCLELSNKDQPHNRTGVYCSPLWDGVLCWEETQAGTYLSQNCPEYPDLDPTEKVTKYCDEWGDWVQSSSINNAESNCRPRSKDKLKVLGHNAAEPTTEAKVQPMVNQIDEMAQKKILDGQYKCFEKMNRDPPYNKTGLYCSRNWDGWLCWDDTPAGTYTSQNCPNHFGDFDSTEKATKYCEDGGQWFRHPDTNRTWSDYTLCNAYTEEKLKSAHCWDGHDRPRWSTGD